VLRDFRGKGKGIRVKVELVEIWKNKWKDEWMEALKTLGLMRFDC
jgi:hypothetical protein